MAAFAPNKLDNLLLTGRAGPRLLNETSAAMDVWRAYARDERDDADNDDPQDLLLTPYDTTPAATLAKTLFNDLRERMAARGTGLFPLEGAVAVKLTFKAFVSVVLPATGFDLEEAANELFDLIGAIRAPNPERLSDAITVGEVERFCRDEVGRLSPPLRTAAVVLLIASYRGWGHQDIETYPIVKPSQFRLAPVASPPRIWRVSLNRRVEQLGVSVETIKADAAQRVFAVSCKTLTWAVIDSGIDGSHPAFRDHSVPGFASRVDRAFDFSRMRDLASYDVLFDQGALNDLLDRIADTLKLARADAEHWLEQLREDAFQGRPYDWKGLSKLLETEPDKLRPDSTGRVEGHGTHVAGILAGDWREGDKQVHTGVCPDLRLIDLRVIGQSVEATEFAVIAALEFVRWMNTRNRYIAIHGVNLSIGLTQDKTNHACGRTPVCMACEATVASGVTVVAAAGNWGSHSFTTATGVFEGYAGTSIADPGNAESVITVGATHRERPHEYGVSFFSSRGPTGDGRNKPDVVAPGERIDGPLPNLGYGRLDGTSMSAPHVSGVAALLMARHPELISDPRRVKTIIVSTATDLGRERHFQGAGLVDALRALQSV